MQKNGINWKRTWCGSILEIVCPILLMFVIVWARKQVDPIISQEFDITQIKKPFYPTTILNQDGQWSNTNFDATKQGLEMRDFMQHAQYVGAPKIQGLGTIYEPLIDPLSPYYMFPQHCYERKNRYNSPIIAYIYQGNQIEQDMIDQLELLFAKQKLLFVYTDQLLEAFQNDPYSSESLLLYFKLLDGGTNEEKIQILQELGVPAPLVQVFQIIANQTSDLQNLQNQPLQDLNKTIQNQINQTTDRLENITRQNIVNTLGLSQNQTEILFNTNLTQLVGSDGVQNITNQLQLTQNQTTQFTQIINQFNETFQKQIIQPREVITQLLSGNITEDQILIEYNTTLDQVSSQLNLTSDQTTQLKNLAPYFTNDYLTNRLNNSQIQLLALAATQNISLSRAQELIQFQDPQLLLDTLNQQNFNTSVLIPELQTNFNLTQQQTEEILSLFQSNSTNQSNQFFSILNQGRVSNQSIFQQIQTSQTIQDQLLSLGNINLTQLAKSLGIDQQLVTQIQTLTGQTTTNSTNTTDCTIDPTDPSCLDLEKIFSKIYGQSNYKEFGNFRLQKFQSRNDLDNYIKDKDYGNSNLTQGICFGFQIIENAQNDYELDLIFNDLWPNNIRSLPNQKLSSYDPTKQNPDVGSYQQYVTNGFSFMNNLAANTIIKRKTINSAQIVAMITPTKITTVSVDPFKVLLEMSLTLFFLLMYIPLIYRTVYRIVFEKVTKAKESMRIMGMTDFPYWTSWWAYYTIVNTVLSTGVWLVLNINAFHRASAILLWIVIWCYGQSLFGLILVTQSFFTAPRAAAITTTVVYFGIAFLNYFIDPEDTPFFNKFAVCWWFPQVAMIQTMICFIEFDSVGIIMNSKSFTLQFENFSVAEGIFLMIISGIGTIIIGLYLEAVMPKTFGQRKHPLFFLGFPCRKRNALQNQSEYANIQFETKYLRADCFEPAPYQFQQKELSGEFVKISDLKKTYDNGFKAVDGINLKMYADQIFVLLGHNGAGKTTTFSMLTGLLNPTEGHAEVYGLDLFNEMSEVRKFMGICPQHDVLFELLTTQEHLSFFYDLKGANPDKKIKEAEIKQLMQDCGVYDKRNDLAYQLSGGNKRKLSLAIALCGNSKFILLDEPTSGMDIQARRQLWNILKQYKKDRIIVLTTHYMDEADILGDRIGIMAKGKMTCLGSSIFLKNKFGVGYNLTIVKTNNDTNIELMDYLYQNLGAVSLQSEIQSEMTIRIPQHLSYKFADFFEQFDRQLLSLNIQSYGISISTLEEVFLKVGHLEDPTVEDSVQSKSSKTSKTSVESKSSGMQTPTKLLIIPNKLEMSDMRFQKLDRKSLQNLTEEQSEEFQTNELDSSFVTCLMAVLFKRFSNYKRNRKAFFNEVFIPAAIVVIGLGITRALPAWQSPSRLDNLDRYPNPQQLLFNPYSVKDNQQTKILSDYLPQAKTKFNVTYYSGDQDLYKFGDAVWELGKNYAGKPPYMYGSYQIYEADRDTQQYKFLSFVNTTSQDVAGIYPQLMYESILKFSTGDPNFKFKLRSSAYPPTFAFTYRVQAVGAGVIIFVTAIAYSVMMTSVVSYLVVERIEGLKHLQEISGMQLKAYWIGNFITDFIKMQLTIIVTIICMKGFDMGMNTAWISYLVFPLGALPFTYITSFIFTADSAAQTFTMFFHFLTISILSTVTFALRLAPTQQLNGDRMNMYLKSIPTYPIASSVFCDISCTDLASVRQKTANGTGPPLNPDVWHISNNKIDMIVPLIHLICWSLVLILIEKGIFRCLKINHNKEISNEAIQLDDDVQKEQDRVKFSNDTNEVAEAIQVTDLKKVYRTQSKKCCLSDSLVAVSNLSFSLQNGECFALLGVNGAGKSTTFKSLTCEVKPTSGKIKIAGFDVSKNFEHAKKLIGYCPQNNLIFETVSVEEHIRYYARIKGIPQNKIFQTVEKTIEQLGLQEQRKKQAGTLSGGNKRKLCVAQALVGSPPIILLDEPSAGMDPEARRFMWSVVAKISQRKSSAVVLTTHSMEEAEALSTKMGIMVKGGIFKCFGSAQHIKNKFGTGFVIELKIKTIIESQLWDLVSQYFTADGALILKETTKFSDNVIEAINISIHNLQDKILYRELHSLVNLYNCILDLCETFANVEMLEHYGNYMRLRVNRLDRSIGSIFGLVEGFKEVHQVETYSVSQTTLEQIFQSFADEKFNEKVVKLNKTSTGEIQIINFEL